MRSGTNVHVYPSTFEHESRILRETATLAAANIFDRILIVATWRAGLPQREELDSVRSLWRIRTLLPASGGGLPGKIARHVEWLLRLLGACGRDVVCVNCHSLSVLPFGVLLKLVRGVRLIYDTHELETETAGMRGLRQHLARRLERVLIRNVDEVIVVNESIANWYRDAYQCPSIHVVRNIPSRQGSSSNTAPVRTLFQIGSDALLFMYLGLLSPGRGIEALIQTFNDSTVGDRHLVLVGYGPMEPFVRERLSDRVHFHPAVRPSEVPVFARAADVGVCLIEPKCESYRLSLPNKLFEYLASGVPVIVSDLPEMSRLVDSFDCGWKVDLTEGALRTLITGLEHNEVSAKRAKAERAAETLSWESEATQLLQAYQ